MKNTIKIIQDLARSKGLDLEVQDINENCETVTFCIVQFDDSVKLSYSAAKTALEVFAVNGDINTIEFTSIEDAINGLIVYKSYREDVILEIFSQF